MNVFESIAVHGHEEVLYGFDPVSGLRAIIAIHSTALGPALGGTRFHPYDSEADALVDVLRLSRGMSYKAAAAGLDLGGGKAVIIGDPHTSGSERLFRAYGRIVDSLSGRYITAEDVGTTCSDMEMIRRETRWALGIPVAEGGSGDPSPVTARGLLAAVYSVGERVWGSDDLAGRRVAVQGVGKVGSAYVGLLVEAGAEVVISDANEERASAVADEYGVKVVAPDEILFVDCDLLSPCALGAVFDDTTIPRLACTAIAGSANNQLLGDAHAQAMAARGILYAPDFVVNAGGLINVAEELRGYSTQRALHRVDGLRQATASVLDEAARMGISPHKAAVARAERRLKEIGDLRRFRRGGDDRN
jgi:glutamate dehydrogenase/leucine dehydrogenase